MSYSRETLEKALELFNNAKPDLNARGFSTSNLESYLYDLRDKPKKSVGGCTATWIDNDESGDYTPTSDSSQNPKRPIQQEKEGEGQNVTLKLNSHEGKELLTEISRDSLAIERPVKEDLCSESPTSWPFLPLPKLKTPFKPLPAQYDPGERRSSRIRAKDQNARGTRSLLSLAPEDPEMRGCKSCYENYYDCSLLNTPTTYPCQVCRDNKSDCDLIVPPEQKRPCENCQRKQLACSYEKGTRCDGPCRQCKKYKTECVAGPAKGQCSEPKPTWPQNAPHLQKTMTIMTRAKTSLLHRLQASTDQSAFPDDPTIFQDSDPINTCSPNTAAKGQTSVTSESPDGPNLNSGRSTPSPSLRRLRPRPARLGSSLNVNSFSPSDPATVRGTAGSSLRPSRAKGSSLAPKLPERTYHDSKDTCDNQPVKEERQVGGKSIIIRTRFAHPICFDYTPPRNGSKPCHWCHDFTYGILGLGDLEVEVVRHPSKAQYIEARNCREPSRMCNICALERLHIGNCSGHTIAPINDLDEDTFDFQKAFLSWKSSKLADRRLQTNPWCSLCPNPAFYKCNALQKFSKFREPLQFPEEGCGLLLCSDCAEAMTNCDSNIAKTVDQHRHIRKELRADVEFLLPGSDLFQAYYGPCG